MKKSTIVKIVFAALLWFVYGAFVAAVAPEMTNAVAMSQMSISGGSFATFSAYQYISKFGWIVLIIIEALLLKKDFINIIKKTKEKNQ